MVSGTPTTVSGFEKTVARIENIFSAPKTTVEKTKAMVEKTNTMVRPKNTLVGTRNTMGGTIKTMVGTTNTMVEKTITTVGTTNSTVGAINTMVGTTNTVVKIGRRRKLNFLNNFAVGFDHGLCHFYRGVYVWDPGVGKEDHGVISRVDFQVIRKMGFAAKKTFSFAMAMVSASKRKVCVTHTIFTTTEAAVRDAQTMVPVAPTTLSVIN